LDDQWEWKRTDEGHIIINLRTNTTLDNSRAAPPVWPEMAFRNFENDPFHHLIRKEETERLGIVLSSVKGSFLSQNEMMN